MAKKFENPTLNGKTKTNAIHPVAFINQPLAAPHQSFLPIGSEVPLVKKSSFPPGEAKNSKDVGDNHSTKRSIARASGRQVGDPYGTPKIFDLQQPTYYTPSVRGGAKAASPLGSPGWRPLRCNSTDNAFIYS